MSVIQYPLSCHGFSLHALYGHDLILRQPVEAIDPLVNLTVYRGRFSRRIYLLGREKPLDLVDVDSVQSLSCFSRLRSDSDAVFVYNRDPMFETL